MGKHDGRVIIRTDLDNSNLQKGIGGISGALGGLGSVLKKVAGAVGVAFSISAVVNFAKEAVKLGSDLQEVQNVVDVTFSTMSDKANEFAKNAMHTAGLSESMAKKYTGTFGAMAKTFKFTEAEALEMATSLTQLSGDVASFYNITQDEAYTKLSAVFTGETEALKHLGVAMTQNALDEYAVQRGLAKTTEKMTEQEKVALRYKFVLEQLSGASGDFVRTSDSWANQTRLLSLQFDQLKATIGQGLINALTPVIKVINTVISKVQVLANAFASLTAAFFGNASGGSGGVVSELADSYGSAADGADELAKKTKAAGDAAKRSLAGFDEIKKLDAPDSGAGSSGSAGGSGMGDMDLGLTGGTGGTTQAVALEIEGVVAKIRELIEPLMRIDFGPAKTALAALGESFMTLGNLLGGALEWAWFNILVPLAEWTIEDVVPASLTALSDGLNAVTTAAKPVGDGLQKMWEKLTPVVDFTKNVGLAVFELVGKVAANFAAIFEEKGSKVIEIFENLGTIISVVHKVLEPFITAFFALWAGLPLGVLTAELNLLIDRLHALTQILAGILTGDIELAWSGLCSLISTEMTAAGAYIDAFAGLLGIDMDAIRQKIDNTCANIREFFSGACQQVCDIWSQLATWFNDNVILPIQEFFSPLTEWFGELFGEIERTVSEVGTNIGILAEGCCAIVQAVWDLVPGWSDENVINPVREVFDGMWSDVFGFAEEAWQDIQTEYEKACDWFDLNVVQPIEKAFSDLWGKAPDWAHDAYDEIKRIFEGIGPFFKGVLNDVIRWMNSGLRKIFGGVNDVIQSLRSLEIAGIAPFSGLRTISTPSIPYLARGAVLPPNKPFLAMVGDQRHGTNIEAPLATIQEAVALVMQDMMASNMAGHEATVAVLREILEAVLGIQIGDDVIASAVDRHRRKMAIVRGEAL